jgi:hypothetical protein
MYIDSPEEIRSPIMRINAYNKGLEPYNGQILAGPPKNKSIFIEISSSTTNK